jgi:hypothetical protein
VVKRGRRPKKNVPAGTQRLLTDIADQQRAQAAADKDAARYSWASLTFLAHVDPPPRPPRKTRKPEGDQPDG